VRIPRIAVAAIPLLLAVPSAEAADATIPNRLYHLEASIPLGDSERWDYVTFDPKNSRVYVAHGDHVSVVDPQAGTVVGGIGPLPGGTHGIGIASDEHVGYTDDGKAGVAVAFDLKSLKILKQIPAAEDADGVLFDPASQHVFVINGDSGSVTVIDPKTNSSIATITIGAGLEAAVLDGRGKLFIDGAENHDIVVVDTRRNVVLAHFPLQGCERPHGIAIDVDSHRVFSTCVNKVMVAIDTDTGRNVATVPIGAYSDGAAFDPKRKWILSPNGEGTLSVIEEKDPDHFVLLGNVPTAPSARTIAIDEATGRIFLPAAEIASIDPPTTPGGRPHVTFVPGSTKLLVFAPSN